MTTNEQINSYNQINSYRDKMKRNRKHCEMTNMYVILHILILQFYVNNISTNIENGGPL